VEASAIQAPTGLGPNRIRVGTHLLRLRSDQQLVTVFRAGNDDAFRVIHDRYRQRLLVYMRQMMPGCANEAEDLLQEVFVRAYRGLRANDRDLTLRPWLYRVARNRCVDELRRPALPPGPELLELTRPCEHDPVVESEQRESLRRLITDVGRLPEQQRSALLLRELSGMSYSDVASVLGVSVPAVKSLLVRARVGLGAALEARDTACGEIREELALAHDRGMRPNALARRHLRDCTGCREYRAQVRGVSKQLAALAPTAGPLGLLAKLGMGTGGSGSAAAGGAAAGGAAAGGAAATAGGVAGTGGAFASAGALGISAGHVTVLVAAAVITAGGAVDLATRSAPAPASHAAVRHVSAAPAARHHAALGGHRGRSIVHGARRASSGKPTTDSLRETAASSASSVQESQLQSTASSTSSTTGVKDDGASQGSSTGSTSQPCVPTTTQSSSGPIASLVAAVSGPSSSSSTTAPTTSPTTCTSSGSQPSDGTSASGTDTGSGEPGSGSSTSGSSDGGSTSPGATGDGSAGSGTSSGTSGAGSSGGSAGSGGTTGTSQTGSSTY
jgi:RNA polymerase sigma factor (sigma-70 family)